MMLIRWMDVCATSLIVPMTQTFDNENLDFHFEYEDRSREEWLQVFLGDTCVAKAKIRRSSGRIVVKFLTVHEGYERRGIGRRIVERLIKSGADEVIAKGVKYKARGFWEKNGFTMCDDPRFYRWVRGE